jgi:serine/threonine protein kinase
MTDPESARTSLVGRQVGVYTVKSLLGAGGMGDVYRAYDSKLHRNVALKVLPDFFAGDPERLTRFRREAQVLASLNHPNIAGIYGFEEADGVSALVLELVEGETLAGRLGRGPVPLEDALPIARQIAEGLDAAHERGIIHRDLKPSNIAVRSDGTVKVLDFGLAKALSATSKSDEFEAPTLTSPVGTAAGIILGTAAYMAPEQAKGREADRRVDVWGFGCVVYEMLVGRAPFEGDTTPEVLAAVLKNEPDWSRLAAETPEGIRRMLRRCLQKDPRQRLQHIGDARLEIDEVRSGQTMDRRPGKSGLSGSAKLAWILGSVVVLIAFATGVGVGGLRPAWPATEARLEISTPPTTDPASFAISPDGQRIVFVASLDGHPRLWLRFMNSSSARPLSGTDLATLPFWSPDSLSVGFFADGKLKLINIDVGSVKTLTNAPWGSGGTWNRDGTILFAPSLHGGIFRISAAGGERVALTHLEERQEGHRHPQFLPDGRTFLYYVMGNPETGGVYVSEIGAAAKSRRLLEAEAPAVYASSGHLLVVRQGTLFAQRFDPGRLELTGNPVKVAEQVPGNSQRVALSASAAGPIIYRSGLSVGQRQFVWLDRSGKEIRKVGDADSDSPLSPSISPDGGRVAMHRTVDGNVDIFLLEVARGVRERFTTHIGNDIFPVWSPGGSRIIFSSRRAAAYDLYQKSVTRSDDEQLLLKTPSDSMSGPATAGGRFATDWSRDGRFVLYRSAAPTTKWDIWALPLEGDPEPISVAQTEFDESNGQFSPDGKWIAYESNKSGQFEIHVKPFPGPGVESQVSTHGGAQVRWRRDGNELFYIALDGRLMTVPVRRSSNGQAISTGEPVPLFATRLGDPVQWLSGALYIVSPDGQRFLMNNFVEQVNTSPLTVILNWKPQP